MRPNCENKNLFQIKVLISFYNKYKSLEALVNQRNLNKFSNVNRICFSNVQSLPH